MLQAALQEYVRVRQAAHAEVDQLAMGSLVDDPLGMCSACAAVPTATLAAAPAAALVAGLAA